MKRTFEFGKINYYGKRKINLVTVDVELSHENVFTASAMVYNATKTDIVAGGQCLDSINDFKEELNDIEKWNKIYRLWKLYHLNIDSGSKKQCHVVSLLRKFAGINDYYKHIEFLKKHDLYIHEGREYGKKWYTNEIPPEDLIVIRELLEG